MQVAWNGVIPAITTPFDDDMEIDLDLMARHARWLVDAGCVGIVPFGSLGEGATVSYAEKLRAVERLAAELDGKAPIIPAVSSLSTAEAVRYVRDAEPLLERLRLTPSPFLTNVALAPDGTAYVTDTTAGNVLALDGWGRPGLLAPAPPR